MLQVEVILFKEDDGTVPLIDWFGRLPPKARVKSMAWLKRLETFGHERQRPDADYPSGTAFMSFVSACRA